MNKSTGIVTLISRLLSLSPSKGRPIRNRKAKVGRNELCPCGSGKKSKRCCDE